MRIMMVAMHQAPTRYTIAGKNLLFWVRLAVYCDVDVDHTLLNAVRAFLAEHTMLLSIINFSKNVCLKMLRNSATLPSDIYRIVMSGKLALFFLPAVQRLPGPCSNVIRLRLGRQTVNLLPVVQRTNALTPSRLSSKRGWVQFWRG